MATQRYRSIWVIALVCSVFLTAILLWGNANSRASGSPSIDRENTILVGSKKKGFRLEVVGKNFQPGATIVMETSKGNLASAAIRYVDETKLVVENVTKKDFKDGVATIEVRNPDGSTAKETLAVIPSAIGPSPLTVTDIQQIIAQGAAAALKLNLPGTMCVMDREGNILALFQMTGAPKTVVVQDVGTVGQGLEGIGGPILPGIIKSEIAAISKAGVGAFFGTQGNAFSTRTAAYIIREHIPPFIKNMPGGPLFGVQVSSLGCSDIKQPGLPLGLAGDTGAFPVYKNGVMAGGFSFEGNGMYTVALNRPGDLAFAKGNKDKKVVTSAQDFYFRDGIEEQIAGEALKGFEAPDAITGDKILVNGIRLPYTLEYEPVNAPALAFRSIPGKLLTIPEVGDAVIRTGVRSEFRDITLRNLPVRVVNRFFPFKNSPTGNLTKADAEQMLFQAAQEAFRVRAAIRRPIEVFAEVNISCVDQNGTMLGLVSTPDAPVFGFDVSAEKIRSAVFFSRPDALSRLRTIGLGKFSTRFEQEAFPLGQFFLTSRSVGWLARPFYPDGIEDRQEAGPPILSVPPADFSPINNGFQTDYLLTGARPGNPLSFVLARSIVNISTGKRGNAADFFCDASNGRFGDVLNNTLMIFSGSTPAFKNGTLAGGIGISGDGIDQDNIIAAFGVIGFEVPDEKRADRIFYRGIRVPYNKFPRHPHLGEEADN